MHLLNENISVNRVQKSIERISRDDRNILAESNACNYLEK
jgi:tRNA G37 N-methylase Trm5